MNEIDAFMRGPNSCNPTSQCYRQLVDISNSPATERQLRELQEGMPSPNSQTTVERSACDFRNVCMGAVATFNNTYPGAQMPRTESDSGDLPPSPPSRRAATPQYQWGKDRTGESPTGPSRAAEIAGYWDERRREGYAVYPISSPDPQDDEA